MNNIKQTFYLIVVIALTAVLTYIVFGNKQHIEYVSAKAANMQASEKEQIVYKKDTLKIKKNLGQENAIINTMYVPREGSVTIKTPKEKEEIKVSLLDKIQNKVIKEDDGRVILLKNRGFTFRPAIAVSYGSKLNVAGQARLVYWARLGAGAGYDSERVVYVFSDYILPYLSNASIGLKVGRGTEKEVVGINLALYFW